MAEIIARTSSKDYPITIRSGLLDQIGEKVAATGGAKKAMVITDTNVAHGSSRAVPRSCP